MSGACLEQLHLGWNECEIFGKPTFATGTSSSSSQLDGTEGAGARVDTSS